MIRALLGPVLTAMAVAGMLLAPICGCSKQTRPKLATFHSPYANKHCTQCHLPPNIGASHRLKAEEPTGVRTTEWVANPWMLAVPLDQLCTKCHRYDTSNKTVPGKLWIHAPSAQGACIVCHSPHLSEHPYMLRRQSTRLCTDQCHAKGFMLQTEVHSEPRHCLECHNPHVGVNAQMLKKDYREVWLEPKTVWVAVDAGVKQ